MRSYHREDMRHLNDSERYRDYDYLADDAWIGPNERVPSGAVDAAAPPWSTMGDWEADTFALRQTLDDRGQGRDYGRDLGLGYGRESDIGRGFERTRRDDYDRGYARPRDAGETQRYDDLEARGYGRRHREDRRGEDRDLPFRGAPSRPLPRHDAQEHGARGGVLHGVIDTLFHPAQALRSVLFRGRGPKNWVRSDARIHDDVCGALEQDELVDASEIEVVVRDAEVTLTGTVESRSVRYRAEDVAAEVLGVKDVHNRLRVARPRAADEDRIGVRTSSTGAHATSSTGASRR